MTQTSSSASSLFLRLLPTLGSRDSKVRVDGHEEFLTQVVGAVLEREPGIARRLLKSWLHLDVPADAQITISTEVCYPVPDEHPPQQARVDLVIDAPGHLVYIENKLGAALNRYISVSTGIEQEEDQVERYARVVRAQAGSKRKGHVLVLAKLPASRDRPRQPPEFRGRWFWWDLYEQVSAHLASGGPMTPEGRYLAGELLEFMREVRLDPARPLRREHLDQHDAIRLLADAAGKATSLTAPRVSSRYLRFNTASTGTDHTAWFERGGELHVARGQVGRLQVPPLDEAFWAADAEQQISFLAEVLDQVDSFAPVPGARLVGPLPKQTNRYQVNIPLKRVASLTVDQRLRLLTVMAPVSRGVTRDYYGAISGLLRLSENRPAKSWFDGVPVGKTMCLYVKKQLLVLIRRTPSSSRSTWCNLSGGNTSNARTRETRGERTYVAITPFSRRPGMRVSLLRLSSSGL